MWPSLQSLLRASQIGQSRSSIINPLQWTLVVLLFGILTALWHGPAWLLIFFVVVFSLVMALLLFAYVYFMLKNPDFLRSERFSLAKTAIEKQGLGDNLSGLRDIIDIVDGSDRKLLGPGTKEENRHE
jgi:uncharacterized membrane protein YraQ (UPF0718 family)